MEASGGKVPLGLPATVRVSAGLGGALLWAAVGLWGEGGETTKIRNCHFTKSTSLNHETVIPAGLSLQALGWERGTEDGAPWSPGWIVGPRMRLPPPSWWVNPSTQQPQNGDATTQPASRPLWQREQQGENAPISACVSGRAPFSSLSSPGEMQCKAWRNH